MAADTKPKASLTQGEIINVGEALDALSCLYHDYLARVQTADIVLNTGMAIKASFNEDSDQYEVSLD
jgi:hypothetical protein